MNSINRNFEKNHIHKNVIFNIITKNKYCTQKKEIPTIIYQRSNEFSRTSDYPQQEGKPISTHPEHSEVNNNSTVSYSSYVHSRISELSAKSKALVNIDTQKIDQYYY